MPFACSVRRSCRGSKDASRQPPKLDDMPMNIRKLATLGSVLFVLSGGAAVAEDIGNYPNRPVMMNAPFAPGGASDFVARMIQQGVGESLGQQIVVDNCPGAAGIVGTESSARALPDGYTAFFGNIGTVSINPAVFATNM